jgi:hypothetical protein
VFLLIHLFFHFSDLQNVREDKKTDLKIKSFHSDKREGALKRAKKNSAGNLTTKAI